MNPLTLVISLGFTAGAFLFTYGVTCIACAYVSKYELSTSGRLPVEVCLAVVLGEAGVVCPHVLAFACARTIVAPSAVPVVVILASLASLAALPSAWLTLKRKLK